MAVESHDVHEKVKRTEVRYGCWNLPRTRKDYRVPVRLYNADGEYCGTGVEVIPSVMSALCRNTGTYSKDSNGSYSWKEDAPCEGCNPLYKDHAYISKMRRLVEQEVQQTKLRL